MIIGILSAGAFAACSTTPSHPVGRTATAPSATSEVRSYSSKQLQATGKQDAAHALQMLDPSIRASPP